MHVFYCMHACKVLTTLNSVQRPCSLLSHCYITGLNCLQCNIELSSKSIIALGYYIICNIELQVLYLSSHIPFCCLFPIGSGIVPLLTLLMKLETLTQYTAQYFILSSFLSSFQDRCQWKWNGGSSMVWIVMTERKHLILSVVLMFYVSMFLMKI